MKKVSKFLKKIVTNDPVLRFELLTKISKLIFPRYRFKWPDVDWWNNDYFNGYLEKFDQIDSMNTDRRWMQYQLMRLVHDVPGDTAECGVFKGAGSYLICKINTQYNKFDRTHFIFDSFEGLSTPLANDGNHWSGGDLSFPEELLIDNLSEFTQYKIYKGWIPERFEEVEDKLFSFVHIDVDLFEPTYESFQFFYSRLNEGGIIICDDYGLSTCPGATKSIDDFLEDKKEKMISLADGAGFIIKGVSVSSILQ